MGVPKTWKTFETFLLRASAQFQQMFLEPLKWFLSLKGQFKYDFLPGQLVRRDDFLLQNSSAELSMRDDIWRV